MNSHEFQVYKHEDGSFRSRLIDRRGKIVRFPVRRLSPELGADDAQFFRRNVQAALAERFHAKSGDAFEGSVSKLRLSSADGVKFFGLEEAHGFISHTDGEADAFVHISLNEHPENLEMTGGTLRRAKGVAKRSTSSNNSG